MTVMTTSEEIVAEAHRLVPLLADHAAEAEAQRRPPSAVIEQLREARLFDLFTPRAFGGLELDVDSFVEVVLALARGDASMSWLTGFYIMHNWMFCHFPIEFQEELFANAPHVLAPAAIAPMGKVEATDGGVRLSGRWSWGTGINDAPDWVIVGVHRPSANGGKPQILLCAVPRDVVEVEDVWHTSGMRATGSHDIVVKDVVIAAQQMIDAGPLRDGVDAPEHDAPLYRTPMLPMLILAVALPVVGQARGVADRFADRIQGRTLLGTKTKQSDTAAAQMRLARAELECTQAEGLIRSTVAELMELRNHATVADRARLTAQVALAVDQSKRVVRLVAEASGASAYFSKDPLQRTLRDVEMMTCHPTLSFDTSMEMHGRLMLGLEPNGPV